MSGEVFDCYNGRWEGMSWSCLLGRGWRCCETTRGAQDGPLETNSYLAQNTDSADLG